MKYYTSANTASGVVDFTDENIFDVDFKVNLICENQIVKSDLLNFFHNADEKIISLGSPDLLDGIVYRRRGLAIVGNCESPDKTYNIDEHLGLKPFIRQEEVYEKMLACFTDAKEIHDQWEDIYIKNMDFESLDCYNARLINRLVTKKSVFGSGKIYKRFFGTSTINGAVNHIGDITRGLEKRYFIKGRPGTGKSTFLKKLSARLTECLYDVEEYYCGFDDKSLDMVVCRGLSFCVFDSTPPHERFPEKETDEIFDFYLHSGLLGIDERFERQLFLAKSAYDTKIKQAMEYFRMLEKPKMEWQERELLKISSEKLKALAEKIIADCG